MAAYNYKLLSREEPGFHNGWIPQQCQRNEGKTMQTAGSLQTDNVLVTS